MLRHHFSPPLSRPRFPSHDISLQCGPLRHQNLMLPSPEACHNPARSQPQSYVATWDKKYQVVRMAPLSWARAGAVERAVARLCAHAYLPCAHYSAPVATPLLGHDQEPKMGSSPSILVPYTHRFLFFFFFSKSSNNLSATSWLL